MLSHYLRPNTWPQKFLLESSSPGLGQFSVFSVIGVGQPRVPLFKYLEEQQERGIPSSVAVLSNMYTDSVLQNHPGTLDLQGKANLDTLCSVGTRSGILPHVCGSQFALEQRTRCPSICETREFVVV